MSDLTIFLSLLGGTLCVAVSVLFVLGWLDRARVKSEADSILSSEEGVVFLFEGDRLINATDSARSILATATDTGSDWSRFLSIMSTRFPGLQGKTFGQKGPLNSNDGQAILSTSIRNGFTRITVVEHAAKEVRELDQHALCAMERELETLRSTTDELPYLAWRETPDGAILWANRAYLEVSDTLLQHGDIPSWPPKRLFDTGALLNAGPKEPLRLSAPTKGSAPQWFDVHRFASSEGYFFTAVSVDHTVAAENSLQELTQTLTKAFSHLTVGLAVFDQKRELALFNPALTDLTALPPEFLIARPSLSSFLDRLRDSQMMPEPKDYKSWRQEMAELEVAAEDGTYEELWSLPGGMTY
ncbi:hypothetical protein [Celeribacter litoreus]|uniref:hypothetical protein n=1 Tax=Celeribacter litoreus TaxID=2876714 RepID=UPI001CD03C56|nr:hypothetical protein [Celeribacter litoreus]MCA0042164.1 hypothetical protein [Celeribacter litoreus]